MTQHLLIGLTGIAGSGKDTAAQALTDTGFTALALADDVRTAALAIDPYVVDPDNRTGLAVNRLSELVDRLGWDQAKQIPEVRRLLQRIGTEAGWMMHGPQLWIDRTTARIAQTPGDVVVTDVRFPAEAQWIHSMGGYVVSVVRPEHPDALIGDRAAHQSELGIGMVPDAVLINDATIAHLHSGAKALIKELRELDGERPGSLIQI